jgi:hypothetical protein
VVKTTVLLGMMSLLSIVAYNTVVGAPRTEALSPDRSVTVPARSDPGGSSRLPARLSEYLFLHQTRYENLPVHAMAGVKACPE